MLLYLNWCEMVDTSKLIVVGDKVLIRPEADANKSSGGLYLPPGVNEKEKVQSGYIVKAGPGYAVSPPSDDEPWKSDNDVKYIPLQVKEGDLALFLRREAIDLELDNHKFVIIPQSSILLLIRDNEFLNF